MPNGDVFPCHVLTQREFRCANVRGQRLLEICRRNGLLGELQALSFREIGRRDGQLAGLAQPRSCMGNVYAQTPLSPAWRDALPSLPMVNA